jgi:hypothetical protein
MYSCTKSYTAHSSLTKYQVVQVRTDGKIEPCASATSSSALGIVQRSVSAGEMVDVVINGYTRALIGSSYTVGTDTRLLMAGTGAKLNKAQSTGNIPIAEIVTQESSLSYVDGDEIEILFGMKSPLA